MVSTPWPHPSLPPHHSVSPSHCVSSPFSPSPAVYLSLFLGLCLPPSLSPFFSLPTPHSMLIPFVFLQLLQEVFSSLLSDLVLTVPASLSLFLSDSPKARARALVLYVFYPSGRALPVTGSGAVKTPRPHNLKGRIDEKINS